MTRTAQEIIRALELSPHPEGGYYKETYRSADELKSPRNGEIRSAVTDIYFLLVSGQISRFHKVVHDEIWHFYEGDPLELVEIQADTLEVSKTVLGNGNGIFKYKHCIKGGNWQAARSTGSYSLMGCTVAPGFDFSDFEFLKENPAVHSAISARYPELLNLI
jgi:predicted cupin superfamily sugar epimerase